MKPTWVFVSGIYRSGSTTQYQMTRDIVEQTKNGIGIGYHTEKKLQEYDDSNHRYIVCKVFKPLFEGFNDSDSYAQKFFDDKRVKAIATMRDPRDVMTSMKKRGEGRKVDGKKSAWSFDETIENFPVWFSDLDKWYTWGAMQTKYEDMIVNLYREAKRIAQHLNIEAEDDLLKSIAKEYTIASIQRNGQTNKGNLPSIPGIVFGTSGVHKTWLSGPETSRVEDAVGWFIRKYNYK